MCSIYVGVSFSESLYTAQDEKHCPVRYKIIYEYTKSNTTGTEVTTAGDLLSSQIGLGTSKEYMDPSLAKCFRTLESMSRAYQVFLKWRLLQLQIWQRPLKGFPLSNCISYCKARRRLKLQMLQVQTVTDSMGDFPFFR